MVEITATYGQGEYSLEMHGHATGSPEVCAACSSLAGAFSGWCSNSRSAWGVSVEEKEGSYTASAQGGQDLETALDTTIAGLFRVEAARPDLVHVSVKKS